MMRRWKKLQHARGIHAPVSHESHVVKEGKPVAAVVPIRNADTETTTLSTSRRFLAVIKRARSRRKKEGGISSKEIRRRLGLVK